MYTSIHTGTAWLSFLAQNTITNRGYSANLADKAYFLHAASHGVEKKNTGRARILNDFGNETEVIVYDREMAERRMIY